MPRKYRGEMRWLLLKQVIILSGVNPLLVKQLTKTKEAERFKRYLPGGKRAWYTEGVIDWLKQKRDDGIKQRWITRRRKIKARKEDLTIRERLDRKKARIKANLEKKKRKQYDRSEHFLSD